MKRDMDLIRLLLIHFETGTEPPELAEFPVEDQIYHLQLLADANLIVADFIRDGEGKAVTAVTERLTWAGHDFLDATRDSKLWKMAKEHVFRPGASWTFSILLEWLKQQARERVFGPNAPI